MTDDPFLRLAQFAERADQEKRKTSRTRCGLCSIPEARKAALKWWEGGGSSTTITAWLKSEYGLVRSPRTIRDCLNKH